MGINIAKVVLNKNYFKSVLLTVAKKYMIIAILPMTYLYHLTHAHIIHNLAPQVLGHGDGGGYAEFILLANRTQVVHYIMATLRYLVYDVCVSFLGDDREHIFCVRGMSVGYLLHCLVPFDRDGRIGVRRMGDIGEHPVFNVGFLQIGYIHKFHASCIKGEQEHVSGECLRFVKIEGS